MKSFIGKITREYKGEQMSFDIMPMYHHHGGMEGIPAERVVAMKRLDLLLDGLCIFLSWVPGIEISVLRVVRVLPIMMRRHNWKGLKILSSSMQASRYLMVRLGMAIMAFNFIWSTIGLDLYQGLLHSRCFQADIAADGYVDIYVGRVCSAAPVAGVSPCERGECLENPDYFPNPDRFRSFDNIFQSFLMVFGITTGQWWSIIASDISFAEGNVSLLYFLILSSVGTFVMFQMVLAIFANEMLQNSEFDDFSADLPDMQSQEKVECSNHERPDGNNLDANPTGGAGMAVGWRGKMRATVLSDSFTLVMLMVVMLSICLLALEHEGMSQSFSSILRWFDIGFIAIFSMELVVKLVSLGPWDYVCDWINDVDGLLTIMAILQQVFDTGGPDFRFFRVVRMCRIVRLGGSAGESGTFSWLRDIYSNVFVPSMSLAPVLMLLVLMYLCIFSLSGMWMLGARTRDSGDKESLILYGGLNYKYDTLLNAVLTTFQVSLLSFHFLRPHFLPKQKHVVNSPLPGIRPAISHDCF
jgi:hypothetical protein